MNLAPNADLERRRMSDRKFLVITLFAAFTYSAATFATFGITGMIIYQTTWWLVVPLFGPFKPDEAFAQGFYFGIIWPWVVFGVIMAMRSRYASDEHSPAARRLHYAAAIYGATLVLACIFRGIQF